VKKILLAALVALLAGGTMLTTTGCRKDTPKTGDQMRSGEGAGGGAANRPQRVGGGEGSTKSSASETDMAGSDNWVSEQARVENQRADYQKWLEEQHKGDANEDDTGNRRRPRGN